MKQMPVPLRPLRQMPFAYDANDSITANDDRRQVFTLNQVGDWAGFQDDAGAGGTGNWDLEQTRGNNKANEITDIDKTAGIDWGLRGVSP